MIFRDIVRTLSFVLLALMTLKASRWGWLVQQDELLGPLLSSTGVVFFAGAVSHLARRIFFPSIDLRDLVRPAVGHPLPSAICFAAIVALLIALLLVSTRVIAQPMPEAARVWLPVLQQEAQSRWPQMQRVDVLAGQIEAETCLTLRHRFCWSPRAELKTPREYGVGLGQLTVTARFNAFDEARLLEPALRGWRWQDRYDGRRQIIALIAMMRRNARYFEAASPDDRIAFALSAYNGGLGGLTRDKQMCAALPGCDYRRWFGHVELHSFRARTKSAGYGRSFFQINRDYVRSILTVRAARYREALA